MATKVTSGGTAPKANKVKRGEAFMAGATARPPYGSSGRQAVPLSTSEQHPRYDPCVCHPSS